MFTLRLRPIKKSNDAKLGEDGPLGLQPATDFYRQVPASESVATRTSRSRECKLLGNERFIVDVFEGTVLMKAMEEQARRVLSRHGERLADFEFLSGQGTLENCHSSIEAIDLKYSPHRRVTMQLSASLDESEIEKPHGYEHTVFEVIKDIDQGISHIFVLDLVDPTSQTSPGLLRAVVNGNEELTKRLLDQGVCVGVSECAYLYRECECARVCICELSMVEEMTSTRANRAQAPATSCSPRMRFNGLPCFCQ
jgi:hypothetical protein